MNDTGKTVGDLRRSNISLILKLLYFEGAQSRKMLSKKANLTPAAVTTLTAELIENGYIVDPKILIKNGKAGRAEQLIDLNYCGLYILGLRIDRDIAEIRVFNLGLECLGHSSVEVPGFGDADALFEFLCDKIALLMVKSSITVRDLLGIGVTINGIVDPVEGVSVDSFGLIEKNTNIRHQIEKRLNLPVSVNNNVRSMLAAESAIHHRFQGVSHLFIKYGPGLGAALSVNQQTYSGVGNRAMELGHITIKPDGQLCRCGRRGCLETLVSFSTILDEADEIIRARSPNHNGKLYDKALSIEVLLEALDAGDAEIRELFAMKFSLLAFWFENFVAIFDPQTISICSEIFLRETAKKLFLEQISKCTSAIADRLELNSDIERIEQTGAAALVVNTFLSGLLPVEKRLLHI